MFFPALSKLMKVCCHPGMLQARFDPDHPPAGASNGDITAARFEMEFARHAIPPEIVPLMPGGGYIRQHNLLDNHEEISCKLAMLQKLLEKFSKERKTKTLLFSQSTQCLDIIERYIKSTGYYSGAYVRLDGSTNSGKR